MVGSLSPEAFRRLPQTLDDVALSPEISKSQRPNAKGKQPMLETDVEFLAELKMESRGEGGRRMSGDSDAMHEDISDDEGQDLCVICLQAVRDPTIVGECGHQIFCVRCIPVVYN